MPLDYDQLRSVLPLQSLLRGHTIILSAKETDALMNIWGGQSDPFGRKVVPTGLDRTVISSLIEKGMLESDKPNSSIVVITGMAREVLKRKILQEPSSFSKKAGVKTASVNAPIYGWLRKAINYGGQN